MGKLSANNQMHSIEGVLKMNLPKVAKNDQCNKAMLPLYQKVNKKSLGMIRNPSITKPLKKDS